MISFIHKNLKFMNSKLGNIRVRNAGWEGIVHWSAVGGRPLPNPSPIGPRLNGDLGGARGGVDEAIA